MTPWHFWPIVTIAFVWHLIGVIDYTATQADWQPWLTLMSGRQQAFVADMPDWIDAAWALSAWAGLVGVILTAFRAGFSPFVLSISMFATLVVAVWLTFIAAAPMVGWAPLLGLWIAVVFTVLLWLYVRDMHAVGVVA